MTAARLPRIRIGASTTVIETDPDADAAAAEAFAQQCGLVLPDLLEPDALRPIERAWRSETFVADDFSVGERTKSSAPMGRALLNLLLSRAPLPQWIAKVAGLAVTPVEAKGDITQLHAGANHRLDWHNDGGARRLLGVTVALGDVPYEGGRFDIKRKGEDDILLSHVHAVPGTALIFRIAPNIVHRVTPVTAGGPRTVYAGWYFSAAE